MSGAHCQVDRARVCGGEADDAPRWRFLVEDALRTAEFGDAGRLVLVRRLRLTGLPARPAPGQAARALEAAWAAQVRLAQPALAAGAAAAPAVWFASRHEARAAWLVAWAEDRGALLSAWFWPAALALPAEPAVAPPTPRAVAAPTAALVAQVWRAAQAAAPQAWPRQLADWPDRRLATLAQRFAQAGLLPSLGLEPEAAAGAAWPADPASGPGVAMRTAEHQAVAAVVRRLQALPMVATLPPAAVAWLARPWLAQALAVERPPPATVRAVRDRIAAAPGAPVEPALVPAAVDGPPPAEPIPTMPVPRAAGPGRGGPVGPVEITPAASPVPAGGPSVPAAAPDPLPPPLAPRATARRHDPGPAAVEAAPWLADGAATTHGGLLFLLNLLPRLGFVSWLAAQPDAPAFVDGLLRHLLDATGAPPEDPQRACLLPGPPADDRRLRLWRLRLRRALRRRVGLDLDGLLRRPAGLLATPTHLDLVFPLDAVDLRLRRAGLDLDPGWVPWFGRIVGFHFL